jgi:chain length determinant protein (polysaccharide antigen chain regulator)
LAAEKKTDGESVLEDKNMDIAERYPADDEIDLFELFSSLCQQWRWLVGITILGALMAVAVALSMPKQYEVSAQVALPDLSGVMQVMNKGYSERNSVRNSEREAGRLFQRYYQALFSPVHFNRYLKKNAWLQKIYPDKDVVEGEHFLQAELKKDFQVEILAPKQPKNSESIPPRLVSITLIGRDEPLTADFINGYIGYTNKMLLDEIGTNGQKMAKAEIEKINNDINASRFEAKKKREARLIKLQDALVIASKVGVKKPDSIRLFPQSDQRSLNGLTSLSDKGDANVLLMGTEYLEAEINILRGKKNDDAYIVELPGMLKRIDELENLSFDFTGVKLYKLDKQAAVDGNAEKPKRALIVAIGTVLSFFVGLLVALVAGTMKRRKEVAAV